MSRPTYACSGDSLLDTTLPVLRVEQGSRKTERSGNRKRIVCRIDMPVERDPYRTFLSRYRCCRFCGCLDRRRGPKHFFPHHHRSSNRSSISIGYIGTMHRRTHARNAIPQTPSQCPSAAHSHTHTHTHVHGIKSRCHAVSCIGLYCLRDRTARESIARALIHTFLLVFPNLRLFPWKANRAPLTATISSLEEARLHFLVFKGHCNRLHANRHTTRAHLEGGARTAV